MVEMLNQSHQYTPPCQDFNSLFDKITQKNTTMKYIMVPTMTQKNNEEQIFQIDDTIIDKVLSYFENKDLFKLDLVLENQNVQKEQIQLEKFLKNKIVSFNEGTKDTFGCVYFFLQNPANHKVDDIVQQINDMFDSNQLDKNMSMNLEMNFGEYLMDSGNQKITQYRNILIKNQKTREIDDQQYQILQQEPFFLVKQITPIQQLDFINEQVILSKKQVPSLKEQQPIQSKFNSFCIALKESIHIFPMNLAQLDRFAIFPNICSHMERYELAFQLQENLQIECDFKNLLKSTTMNQKGSEINYEMLETLGDCILKYLVCSHMYILTNENQDETVLSEMKQRFINNKFLQIKGFQNNIQYYIVQRTASSNEYQFPFRLYDKPPTSFKIQIKQLSDVTEALFGSTIVYKYNLDVAADLISRFIDINLESSYFANQNYRTNNLLIDKQLYLQSNLLNPLLTIKELLELNGYIIESDISDKGNNEESKHFKPKFQELNFNQLSENQQKDILFGNFFDQVEEKLGYKFQNKQLLIQAFNFNQQQKFQDLHKIPEFYRINYQRLEFLGDSIIEALAISNEFEQFDSNGLYVKPEILHNSKLFLLSNNILGKIIYLLGFHNYLLNLDKQTANEISQFLDEINYVIDDPFLIYKVHEIQVPKVLGDIFESLTGALLLDGGWDVVKLVIGKIYAPFIQMYTIFDQYSVFNSVYQIERMQEKLTYEKQKEVISINKNGEKCIYTCIIKNSLGEQIAEGKGLFEKQAIEKAAASYIIKEFKIQGQSFIDSNSNQQNLQPQTI